MRLQHHIIIAFTAVLLILPANTFAQWIQEVGFDDSDMALDLSEAKSFQKYPTYDQYLQMMQGFASDYPDICQLDTFGISEEGRWLLALKISDNVFEEEAEASFLYSSSMHGDEVAGYVLLLRLADSLLASYGSDPEITTLVNGLSIWINPLANPDGSFSNDNNLSLKNATRTNVKGFDLNRNFPSPNKDEADDTTGRALENRHMMQFMKKHQFTMSANLHGGTEVVNYPWDHTYDLHADDNWYRFISREYADEAMAVDPDYMWGWPDNGITNGAEWAVIYGGRQDYVNYYLGGREVTLELSTDKLLPSDQLEHYWNINHRSLLNYMAQCMYSIRGKVTDQDTGDPLYARLEILDHDSAYSVVRSSETHGDFYRLIKEGVYNLKFTANGYFDKTITGVTVTDYQATTLNVQLEAWPVSTPETKTPEFRLYPNPSSGILFLEPSNVPPGELILSIHSLDGKMLVNKTWSWQGGALELDISQLENGLYIVQSRIHSHLMVRRLVVNTL